MGLGRRALALWITGVLIAGSVVAVGRHPDPDLRTRGDDEAASTTTAAEEPVSTTTTTVAAPSTTDAPLPIATTDGDESAAGGGGSQASGRHAVGGIGSVLDLEPQPVRHRDPVPCTPAAQVTRPAALQVLDPAHHCLRVLVPAGRTIEGPVTWSPDSTWLLAVVDFELQRIAADGSWTQDLGGGGQTELAVLSPDGDRMVVEGHTPYGDRNERWASVIANGDGTGAHEVQLPGEPVWAPDSAHMVFTTSVDVDQSRRRDSIIVTDRDGRVTATRSFTYNLVDVQSPRSTPNAGPLGPPHWTSDGRLVVPTAVDNPAHKDLLWFTKGLAESSGPSEAPGFGRYPEPLAPAPNGRTLVYAGYGAGEGRESWPVQIHELNLASGAVRDLFEDGEFPSYAPDGDRVAFAAIGSLQGEPVVPVGIDLGDPSTGTTTRLWTISSFSCTCWLLSAPVWSPSSRLIAVAAMADAEG